jgi:hypothetical protein
VQRLTSAILATYPRWWRDRYGAETAELTAELLADPTARSWRVVTNLVLGTFLAWGQLGRRSRRLLPVAGSTPWGQVPDGGHRDIFFNRGLSVRSGQALEPDEVLLGVIDGWTGSPFLDSLPVTAAVFLLVAWPVQVAVGSPAVRGARSLLPMAAVWVGVLIVGSLLRWATSSRSVSLAVTNKGLVVLRRSRLTSTTGQVIERLPAASPDITRRGVTSNRVRLGSRTFWLRGTSEPLLAWMAWSVGAAVPG